MHDQTMMASRQRVPPFCDDHVPQPWAKTGQHNDIYGAGTKPCKEVDDGGDAIS